MQNRIAEIRNSFEPIMTQEALSKLANVSRPHLSEIENGIAEPGGAVMMRIASVLGKPVEDIFFINNVV